jgi:hypothetical protein
MSDDLQLGFGAMADDDAFKAERGGSLRAAFGVPPFSIMDARQGYWKDRKQAWLGLGIESELGRDDGLLKFSDVANGEVRYSRSNNSVPNDLGVAASAEFAAASPVGRRLAAAPQSEKYELPPEGAATLKGTSVFDPVLCEMAYRWFCPENGRVLDPFAGGSVRGIVAAWLHRHYTGIDLREEQVESNREQAERILEPGWQPEWITGDCLDVLPGLAPCPTCRGFPSQFTGCKACSGESPKPYDMVLSCPPYYDLEAYSDDPRDLSNKGSYEEFAALHAESIRLAVANLRPDSFCVWVVGEIRGDWDKGGFYRGLVPDTIRAFEDAGARFYNECILITAVGSLSIRAARVFTASRKLGKTHQNILIFCKGDPARAVKRCGKVDMEAFGWHPDEPGEEGAEEPLASSAEYQSPEAKLAREAIIAAHLPSEKEGPR